MVCRGLLSNLASATTTAVVVPLEEDAATVRLLISGMYDARSEVSWSTVEALLELARKYDVQDIQLASERFLDAEPLAVSTLPRYMQLACRFGMSAAVERCQDYVATAGNFANLEG
jgi:BTB/POZ domain